MRIIMESAGTEYRVASDRKIRLGAELGYVSIPELLSAGMELDLHWQPRPVSECGKD